MAIITISRELAALGDDTARDLAKLSDYRFIDKQTLEERIKSYGLSPQKLEKYDERKPSLWASLSKDRDDYLHYLKVAMFAEAGEGNCVFIGRGASIVFKDVPAVVSVFLVAAPEIRIERVKNAFRCDDKRARQIIAQSDRDRSGFHQYFFDTAWKDPGNYHLVLNTGYFLPEKCAEIINDLKNNIITEETEKQSCAALKDKMLSQQLVHHILYEKDVPIHFLEASVSDGRVMLFGVANSQSLVEAAVAAAREVDTVSSVHSEIQVIQEYSVMP